MKLTIYAIFTLCVLIIISTGAIMMSQRDSSSGSSASDNKILSAEQFREQRQKSPGKIIDVRTPEEHEEGHLADTDMLIDIKSDAFDSEISKLDKNETYYLYCRSGGRSGKAVEKMKEAGFQEVYNVGGYEQLVSDGFDSDK